MAKTLINIYPGLRAKMSYNAESAAELSKILKISVDSTRRRLRGENFFDLNQIKTLTRHYNCTFDELFAVEESTVK